MHALGSAAPCPVRAGPWRFSARRRQNAQTSGQVCTPLADTGLPFKATLFF